MLWKSQTPIRNSYKIAVLIVLACIAVALTSTAAKADSAWQPGDPVAPLPDGCIRGTPPGESAPLCCMSGFVYLAGRPVSGAIVTISDSQGEVASVYTQERIGVETRPYYFVDLSAITLHDITGQRPITPSDVITLVASYNGIRTDPMTYTVQAGGQNLNLNLYDARALAPSGENTGRTEVGKFQQIFGADVDSQGNLLLWDLGNARMLVLNPDGEWLERPNWQKQFGYLPYQVYGVNDIAIARGGAGSDWVYLADPDRIGNADRRRIQVYTADGDFIRALPDDGYARSLATDGAGNLYSSTEIGGLYRYDAMSGQIKNIRDGLWAVSGSREIAVSAAGDVFVANPNGGRYEIFKFSPDLQSPGVPVTLQTASGLSPELPGEIAVADDGHLYVYDYATQSVFDFDPNGVERAHWSWDEWNLNGLSIGSGTKKRLVISGKYVYVVSQLDGVVIQLDRHSATGTPPNWMVGGREQDASSIAEPTDMTVSPMDSSLFVADSFTGRIIRMVDSAIQQTWTAADLQQPASSVPVAVDFMPNGDLLVLQSTPTLQRFRFDPSTFSLVAVTPPYGSLGSAPGQFWGARSVASDGNGFVFVADTGNNRIQVFAAKGDGFDYMTSISPLSASGIISLPTGIAVDHSASPTRVYVVDDAYDHVAAFVFDGTQLIFQQIVGSTDPANGQIYGPRQLDVGPDGSVWVTDAGFRVHRRTPQGAWESYGDGFSPAWDSYAIAVSGQVTVHIGSWWYGRISTFSPMAEGAPVASIVSLSAYDVVAGADLVAVASGQVASANNEVVLYEWSAPDPFVPLGTVFSVTTNSPIVTIPTTSGTTLSDTLGLGLHWLQLKVKDLDGNWSAPVSTTVYVDQFAPIPSPDVPSRDPDRPAAPVPATCHPDGKWTFLLYLDADNRKDGEDLLGRYLKALHGLETLKHPCIQVVAQLDGPRSIGTAIQDTERRMILPGSPQVVDSTFEAQMDSPAELTRFLRWGAQKAPARHYYLVIADHGNGFQGIAFDETSGGSNWGWDKYLSAGDIRTALTAPGVPHIHVLHLDACSMALFDVAYELRDITDYLVVSQYIGWSFFAYDEYAKYMSEFTPPEQLAKVIVRRYAHGAENSNLPYTIAALNLAKIVPMKTALDKLAVDLKSWVNTDNINLDRHRLLFFDIRNASQFFDSNGNFLNTPRDSYVDARDFVEMVQAKIASPDVQESAAAVLKEFERGEGDRLVMHVAHMTGTLPAESVPVESLKGMTIPLPVASGFSLYYPAHSTSLPPLPPDPGEMAFAAAAVEPFSTVYVEYIAKQSFDFTRATRWSDFLQASLGQPAPDAPLVTPKPPLAPLAPSSTSQLYLPLVSSRTR